MYTYHIYRYRYVLAHIYIHNAHINHNTHTHHSHTHHLCTCTGMHTHTHTCTHTYPHKDGVVQPHLHSLHFNFIVPSCLTELFVFSCSLFCILTNRWQKVWDGVEHHSCLYSDNAEWHGISPRGCPSLSSLASGASPSTVEVKSNFWNAWDSMCFRVWILF